MQEHSPCYSHFKFATLPPNDEFGLYNKFVWNWQQHEADITPEEIKRETSPYWQKLPRRDALCQTLIRIARFTFAHGATLPRHLHGVHAALPTGRGHAVRFSIDALAEGAVIFTPPVPVGADLAIGVAAGGVVKRIDGIYSKT